MSTPTGRSKTSRLLIGIIFLAVFIGIIFFFISFISPGLITPFDPDGSHLGDVQIGDSWFNVFQIVFGNDVDVTWVTTSSILQYLIFPLVAVIMLMYGIFTEMRIFRQNAINISIAIIGALIISSQGYLIRLMRSFLMLGGSMAIVLFGVIFALGTVMWFMSRWVSWGGKVGGAAQERMLYLQVDKQLANLQQEVETLPPTDPRRGRIQNKIDEARKKLAKGDISGADSDASAAGNI